MPSGPDASSCGRFSGTFLNRFGPIGHGPAASLGLRRGREAKGGCAEQRRRLFRTQGREARGQ